MSNTLCIFGFRITKDETLEPHTFKCNDIVINDKNMELEDLHKIRIQQYTLNAKRPAFLPATVSPDIWIKFMGTAIGLFGFVILVDTK